MKLNDKKSGNGVFSTQSFLPAWETSLHPSSQALSCPSPHALWSFALVFQPQISGSLNLLSGFFFPTLTTLLLLLWTLSFLLSCWLSRQLVPTRPQLGQPLASKGRGERDTITESLFSLLYLTALYSSFRTLLKCHLLGAFLDLSKQIFFSGFPQHFAYTSVLVLLFICVYGGLFTLTMNTLGAGTMSHSPGMMSATE